jgi:hypothetical protein
MLAHEVEYAYLGRFFPDTCDYADENSAGYVAGLLLCRMALIRDLLCSSERHECR